ncbi:hypothetical protein B0H16DRAFT_1691521 [Mycena metata]|uniref:Uncharacterized protein n=1 Tax=Mycena metata TaxID=1033252 RepID=A0AAD7IU12_9AGAR|nr:hypothetical protein B0H16DRAFT_1691521 [Mycena metata]
MASRSKRTTSTARPGKIINDEKQKRRTPQEKAAEERAQQQAKAAKQQADLEATLEEETDVVMGVTSDDENDTTLVQDGAEDDDFVPPAVSDNEGSDEDSEAEAVREFLKSRATAKKKAGKTAKVSKDAIRLEINAAGGVIDNTLKRKPSGQTTAAAEVQAKKSKTSIGGLKAGWKKAVGTTPKASVSTTAPRSRANSTVSMSSLASSRGTLSSAQSSVVSFHSGEFDEDETQASVLAARGSKTTAMVDATAKCLKAIAAHGSANSIIPPGYEPTDTDMANPVVHTLCSMLKHTASYF